MSNPTVEYDSSARVTTGATAEQPVTARRILSGGGIPENLVTTSRSSKNYRDAVLAELLLNVDAGSLASAIVLGVFGKILFITKTITLFSFASLILEATIP